MLFVPQYFNSKRNVIILVVGTAIFCMLFLNIFRPFNWDLTENNRLPMVIDSSVTYFIFADVIALVALGVIAVSRVIMYKFVKGGHKISYLIYAFWITVEVVVMTIIFSVATFYLTPGGAVQESFGMLFVKVLLYTGFTLLLPYLIFHFYFAWDDKRGLAKELEQLKADTESGSQQSVPTQDKSSVLLRFNDEKGTLRLSVNLNNLYYIESAENYVNIRYIERGKLNGFLLRTTMKAVENLYPDDLIRCQRSYIVNVNKVKVIRKTEAGWSVGFDSDKVQDIPISRIYSDKFFAALAVRGMLDD